ncbi:hypothetical protein KC316_g10005 [Hortaea werneckii]|nr:hypothetical protein KC324_g11003 [Hortaea werneckii]KAI7578128.1 hypothetical protein KC316_g10005 [Hortaea werneckii]
MFDHFLDSRQNHRQDVVDKCSITYLGESFPLALVLDDLKDGDKTRLHHRGLPMDASASPGDPSSTSPHPLHVRPEEIAFLKAKHAFELPERPILDALMDVFLNKFYPLYPLVNRLEFAEQYHNHNLPWILVHACCFVAATFCAESLIHQAGFTSRREARSAFYNKAKALFDLGYELNKIIVLQSVFMLTFWGGGPNDYWNFYSWIGTGVTIAEKLGIHRSLAGTNMPEKDRSLLKRLWWLLVVRDASCATLVGLPFRINMEHGDVEMLTLEDFQHDGQDETFQSHPLRLSYAQYQIQVAKLSLILYDVDYARFVPGQKKITIEEVYRKMQTWRQEVPAELEWTNDPSHTRLLATCLSILHDHHLMLAGLGRDGGRNAFSGLELATSGHDLGQAALRISNAASGIVTRSQALCAPHETYQGIFLAGVVSYVEMRSGHATLAQLGQLVVSNCQMVLHHVREAWDPSPWVLALFEKLTCSIGTDSQQTIDMQNSITDSSHGQAPFDFESFSGIDEPFGGYSGFGTPLQSNPMLSALFDFPQAAGIS